MLYNVRRWCPRSLAPLLVTLLAGCLAGSLINARDHLPFMLSLQETWAFIWYNKHMHTLLITTLLIVAAAVSVVLVGIFLWASVVILGGDRADF